MKNSTLTIRLDEQLEDMLEKATSLSGQNRSEVAREALWRQLKLIQLTDEDVFHPHLP